jgi:hypothetical protein
MTVAMMFVGGGRGGHGEGADVTRSPQARQRPRQPDKPRHASPSFHARASPVRRRTPMPNSSRG